MPALNPRHLRRTALTLALLTFSLWLPATPARAEEPDATSFDQPWQPFELAPEALLAAADAVAPEGDAPVQLLLRETYLSFDADGRLESRTVQVSRVLRPEGVDWLTHLDAVWRPWHQETPQLRARVVSSEGRAMELDPATIAEVPVYEGSPDILTDRRRLDAPLPTVAAGALIETEVLVRDIEPFFAAGAVHVVAPRGWQPIHRVRVVVEAPRSLPLRWHAELLDVEPVEEALGERVRWSFELGAQPKVKYPEADLPPEVPTYPRLAFSTARSWSAVATAYAEIVDRQIKDGLPAAARQEALAAARAAKGRQARIAALLAWVQERIRYTGLEFGEAALVPYPPASILERGYGDCKDKASLLVGLLREVGIPAQVALLRTGPGRDVPEAMPGLAQFDHAIVYAPGSPDVWIDPTVELARAGQLPIADQNRWALIAERGTKELTRTPSPRAADNRALIERRVELAELEEGSVFESILFEGAQELSMRSSFAQIDVAQRGEVFESMATDIYHGEELTDHTVADPRDLSQPWSYSMSIDKVASVVSELGQAGAFFAHHAVLDNLPGSLLYPESCEEAQEDAEDDDEPVECAGDLVKRRQPMLLTDPFVTELQARIIAPPGFELRELPTAIDRSEGGMRFTFLPQQESPGVATFTARFDSGAARMEPEQVDAARRMVQEISKMAPVGFFFDHRAARLLEDGDIPGALAELRALEGQGSAALLAVRRAKALLAAGLGEAARREARLATEFEPDNPFAHQILGLMFSRDEIGRDYSAGEDRQTAIAAFRRAFELDPENQANQLNLGVALEIGDDGIRYSSSARLDEAIEHYRSQDDDDGHLTGSLAVDLLRTERFEELRALANEPQNRDKLTSFELAAVAASEGHDAALRIARRLDSGAPRAQALAQAASLLVAIRRYEVAANLLDVVARGNGGSSEISSRAAMLHRLRRFEEIEGDPTRPESVVKALIETTIFDKASVPLRFVHEDVKEDMEKDKAKLQSTLHALSAQQGLSPEAFLDMTMGMVETTIEGDPRFGHRLTLSMPFGDEENTLFTVPTEGGHAILADGDHALSPLGERALDLLADDDLEGARQYLRWARETAYASNNDDPLSGTPLAAVWPSAPADEELDAERIRLAATVLAVGSSRTAEVVPVLEREVELASGAERHAMLEALGNGYLKLERYDDAVRLAEQQLAELPTSKWALRGLLTVLAIAERPEEMEKAARRALESDPENLDTLDSLATALSAQGDLAGASQVMASIVEMGKATADTYNQLAWFALLRDEVNTEALGQAEKAVQMSQQKNYAELHTLAAVYAELGRVAEARRTLLEGLALIQRRELEAPDWYVVGRIAEQLGELPTARAAYERLERPDNVFGRLTTSYTLAVRRLEAVTAAEKAASAKTTADAGARSTSGR